MIVVMSSFLGLWTGVRFPSSPLSLSKEIYYGLLKFGLPTPSICGSSSSYLRSFNCVIRRV